MVSFMERTILDLAISTQSAQLLVRIFKSKVIRGFYAANMNCNISATDALSTDSGFLGQYRQNRLGFFALCIWNQSEH